MLSYKLILLGDAGVGKTSIVNRRSYNRFDDLLPMTVGVSNFKAIENVRGGDVELKIWDTAGQEQYAALIPIFSRNSDVCILVCDINSPSSIEHLDTWARRLNDSGCEPPVIVAVNKIDINPTMESTFSENNTAILEKYKDIMFVSARNGSGITELFRVAAEKAFEFDKMNHTADNRKNNCTEIDQNSTDNRNQGKKCCG